MQQQLFLETMIHLLLTFLILLSSVGIYGFKLSSPNFSAAKRKMTVSDTVNFVEKAEKTLSLMGDNAARNLGIQVQAYCDVYFTFLKKSIEMEQYYQCKEQSYFENLSYMAQRYCI